VNRCCKLERELVSRIDHAASLKSITCEVKVKYSYLVGAEVLFCVARCDGQFGVAPSFITAEQGGSVLKTFFIDDLHRTGA
jgi:hypothetical protein